MNILKIGMIVALIIICLIIIVLTFTQTKQDNGASGAIMGNAADTFYTKNKGNSTEAKMDRAINILLVVSVVLCLVSSLI